MSQYWPQPEYMKFRDAFKSAERCEREGIAEREDENATPMVVAKDGGDGENIKPFMHETRRRLVRMEDRMAIQTKILFLMLGSIVMATFVGLVLAFVLG